MPSSHSVTVIGGGTVGLSTAYALWKAGHDVTLVEQDHAVGCGASFANGGQLSYRYVAPLAGPGVPAEALGWLGRPGSPISLHPEFSLTQWRWLLSFLRVCTSRAARQHGEEILQLALSSQQELTRWRQDGLKDFSWRAPGKLILYRNPKKFHAAAQTLADPEHQKILGPDACLQVEPAFSSLRSELAGGIFTPSEEVADCHAFCGALLEQMENSPHFQRLTGRASLKRLGDEALVSVDGRNMGNGRIVVAAGLASRDLVQPLGITLPLYGLRGYSLTLPAQDGTAPSVSVTDYDNRVVYARLGEHLRIAAMVDIGPTSDAAQRRRLQQLKTLAARTLPAAGPYENAETWSGERPATPTSVPIIGPTRYRNLFLNVGQGALGFTLSPGSAKRIVDCVEASA